MKHNISPRGYLEKDDKVLFIEYIDSKGSLYALPGGSQKTGEDQRSALKREFKEETNLDIESHEVLLVREFILDSSEFFVWKDGIHQVEIIFRCTQKNKEQTAETGSVPDNGMKGIIWINKDEIKDRRVYPSKDLINLIDNKDLTYLFDRE